MKYIYLIVCIIVGLSVPYLSADSVTVGQQIIFQILFFCAGIAGFNTFSEKPIIPQH